MSMDSESRNTNMNKNVGIKAGAAAKNLASNAKNWYSKTWFIALAAFIALVPLSASGQKSKDNRGLVEKMEAVPCGASEKGLSGLGALWGSVGVTHLSTNEKLCPQYLFRTDQMDYEIRPLDLKHATILPVGKEGQFQIKKNRMMLRFPDSTDHKTRAYEIVQMDQAQPDTGAATSSNLGSDDSGGSADR